MSSIKLNKLIPLQNPKQDPAWKTYLEYLLEYKPEQAWALFQSKKLERLLDEKATQIANMEEQLVKNGQDRDQARETAYEEFMPSNTDLPDQERLPQVLEGQLRRIWAWADELYCRSGQERTS